MKSPFPGMDPFIEGAPYWGDFHTSLSAKIKADLGRRVPARYSVHLNVRSYIETVEQEGRAVHPFLPDVGVEDRGNPR